MMILPVALAKSIPWFMVRITILDKMTAGKVEKSPTQKVPAKVEIKIANATTLPANRARISNEAGEYVFRIFSFAGILIPYSRNR